MIGFLFFFFHFGFSLFALGIVSLHSSKWPPNHNLSASASLVLRTTSMLHHPCLAQKSQWGEIESRDSSCVFCFLRRCEYTVTCCWGHTVSLTHSLRTTWTWDNSSSQELYYWMLERVFAPPCSLAHGNSGTDGNSWELGWGHTWEPEVLSERTHHYRTSHNTRTRGVKGSVAGQAAPKSRTWLQPHS